MPIEHLPSLTEIKPEATLWRYLDLSKYLALLTSNGLWFSRGDLLGDPFEGSTTEAARKELHGRVARAWGEEGADITSTLLSGLHEGMVRWVYVSCWHQSDWESAAMWQLYKAGHGLALRTTAGRLSESLNGPQRIVIGPVTYTDYRDGFVPTGHMALPFLHKRRSYEYENEVRAIIVDPPPFLHDPPEVQTTRLPDIQRGLERKFAAGGPPGHLVRVNLMSLVEEVRIDPHAPGWFAEVVREATKRLGFDFVVNQSDLLDERVY